MTPYNHELNRVLLGFLVGLMAITLAAVYWATLGPERLLSREDNPRIVEDQASIRRGAIVDRANSTLAETLVDENGTTTRSYIEQSVYSLIGYYSLRYGTSLAEGAYDTLLSGSDSDPTLSSQFDKDVLHIPPVGSDVQLTIDLHLQSALAEALGDSKGAGVILSVPQGELLASVSLPIYDPNTLDENWDELVDDPGDPFFNRALQGQYQPGGIFYIPLLISGMMNNSDIEQRYRDARNPVEFDDITLECQRNTVRSRMTLIQAYRYGCPGPFAAMIETLGENRVTEALDFFDFGTPITLDSFLPGGEDETLEATPEVTPEIEPTAQPYPFTETALGQGDIVVSPLHFATIIGAIINNGNAPEPYTLRGVKSPDSEDWQAIETTHQSIPIMTQQTSQQIENIMVETTTSLGLELDGYVVGAYPALAYTGETTLAWFAGFIQSETGEQVVVVMVFEDTEDLEQTSELGLDILEQAIISQSTED